MARSGVVICTPSSMSSHRRVTSASTASKSALRYRLTNVAGFLSAFRLAQKENDLALAPRLQFNRRLHRRAGIERRAHSSGKRPPRSQSGRRSQRSIASEKFGPVPSPGLCLPAKSAKAIRPPNSPPQALRASNAFVPGSISVIMYGRRSATRAAQYPVRRNPITRNRRVRFELLRSVRLEILMGSSDGNKLRKSRRLYRATHVRIGCSLARDGSRSLPASSRMGSAVGVQNSPVRIIPNVHHFTSGIADWVIRPGRQLVLMAVE